MLTYKPEIGSGGITIHPKILKTNEKTIIFLLHFPLMSQEDFGIFSEVRILLFELY